MKKIFILVFCLLLFTACSFGKSTSKNEPVKNSVQVSTQNSIIDGNLATPGGKMQEGSTVPIIPSDFKPKSSPKNPLEN